MDTKLPIGIFDSGIGGLTVVSQIMRRLPNEKIIYYGDTARAPYGPRPPEEITRFSFEIADFLVSKKVKAIVTACNTIDVTCGKELSERVPVPVFGIFEYSAEAVASLAADASKIGVIATERTIHTRSHIKLLNSRFPRAEVLARACPLFVPLVEKGELDGEAVLSAVSQYLTEFKEFSVEALIFGCTHYPLLECAIRSFLGEKIKLADPAEKLAEALERYLDANGIGNRDTAHPEHAFYLSGVSDGFAPVSRLALGREYKPIAVGLRLAK